MYSLAIIPFPEHLSHYSVPLGTSFAHLYRRRIEHRIISITNGYVPLGDVQLQYGESRFASCLRREDAEGELFDEEDCSEVGCESLGRDARDSPGMPSARYTRPNYLHKRS